MAPGLWALSQEVLSGVEGPWSKCLGRKWEQERRTRMLEEGPLGIWSRGLQTAHGLILVRRHLFCSALFGPEWC